MKNKSLPQNTCYRVEAEHNEANEHEKEMVSSNLIIYIPI